MDYQELNEDGELWLVYEGLKQANRLYLSPQKWNAINLFFLLTVDSQLWLLYVLCIYCPHETISLNKT